MPALLLFADPPSHPLPFNSVPQRRHEDDPDRVSVRPPIQRTGASLGRGLIDVKCPPAPYTGGMERYLVGGAVRDRLLGLTPRERDWVVVGSTPEAMHAAGYQPVGRDFPVFIDPRTGEEHALARTERKSGHGHHGFEFHASPEVSLEQDLARRDLTINAMAETPDGELIDPYGGRRDLDAGLLRHVTPAFAEDPLRVLRVARFAARLHQLGFALAPDTRALMGEIAASGELEALSPERVWDETRRALEAPTPWVFFEVLLECGALRVLFPEVHALFGVPAPRRWHPEIDSGVHTLLVVEQAARLTNDLEVRFAALVHDLGKAATPPEQWPSHHHHGERGLPLIRDMAERLRIPNRYRDLGLMVSRWHILVHRSMQLRPGTIMKLLEGCDAFRRPERFEQLLLACEADVRGRTGLEQRPYPQADLLRACREAAAAITGRDVDSERFRGPQFGEELNRLRTEAIAGRLEELRATE